MKSNNPFISQATTAPPFSGNPAPPFNSGPASSGSSSSNSSSSAQPQAEEPKISANPATVSKNSTATAASSGTTTIDNHEEENLNTKVVYFNYTVLHEKNCSPEKEQWLAQELERTGRNYHYLKSCSGCRGKPIENCSTTASGFLAYLAHCAERHEGIQYAIVPPGDVILNVEEYARREQEGEYRHSNGLMSAEQVKAVRTTDGDFELQKKIRKAAIGVSEYAVSEPLGKYQSQDNKFHKVRQKPVEESPPSAAPPVASELLAKAIENDGNKNKRKNSNNSNIAGEEAANAKRQKPMDIKQERIDDEDQTQRMPVDDAIEELSSSMKFESGQRVIYQSATNGTYHHGVVHKVYVYGDSEKLHLLYGNPHKYLDESHTLRRMADPSRVWLPSECSPKVLGAAVWEDEQELLKQPQHQQSEFSQIEPSSVRGKTTEYLLIDGPNLARFQGVRPRRKKWPPLDMKKLHEIYTEAKRKCSKAMIQIFLYEPNMDSLRRREEGTDVDFEYFCKLQIEKAFIPVPSGTDVDTAIILEAIKRIKQVGLKKVMIISNDKYREWIDGSGKEPIAGFTQNIFDSCVEKFSHSPLTGEGLIMISTQTGG